MDNNIYRVIFIDTEEKVLTVHAKEIYSSEIFGMIELADLVFIEPSDIIQTPDDNKIKNIFKNVEKTFIPLNSIIRIDEVALDRKTPIISIHKAESS